MSEAVDIVAPGATLATVIAVWQRVLQHVPVLAEDNFFDLGGDSLLAIQLFAELERVTGRQLPITTIYDAGTPAQLATLLDDAAVRPAFSPLVLLNTGLQPPDDREPTLFVVHGIGGNVMELARLGQNIEPRRRVFAIQARGLDGIEPAIGSVEEMADYYLAAVRVEQPHGPYLLVGYSFGGIVALEMARRVKSAGEDVGFLGFIDAYPHPRFWPWLSWLDVRWRRAAHTARTRLGPRIVDLWSRAIGGSHAAGSPLGPNALARPFMFDEGWPEPVRRVYDTSLEALSRYRPSAYPGAVAFFRAGSRSFYLPDSPRQMWGGLLGELDIVTVPGDHVDMIGPNASTLGTEIAKRVRAGLIRLGHASVP